MTRPVSSKGREGFWPFGSNGRGSTASQPCPFQGGLARVSGVRWRPGRSLSRVHGLGKGSIDDFDHRMESEVGDREPLRREPDHRARRFGESREDETI